MRLLHKYFGISLFLFMAASTTLSASTGELDINQVKSWLSQQDKKDIKYTKIEKSHVIRSKNKKPIILLEVGYIDFRGVGGCCVGLLVDPALKKAKLIGGSVFEVRVLDLNGDGVDEFEKNNYEFGQGYSVSIRSINQIDGFNISTLHSAKAVSNDGMYEETDPEYKQLTTSFDYQDVNKDGIKDLVEIWRTKTSIGSSESKKIYLFDGTSFKLRKSESN